MSVSLALDLSVERISLLQHRNGCWYQVAQASCDASVIGDELRNLNAEAMKRAGLTTGPVPVFLVLPEEQGDFLSVDTAEVEDNAGALDQVVADHGLDPTRLQLDWRAENGRIEIAAVARETLAEAEKFVASYGFTSAGTLLAPTGSEFPGTPWLGWSDPKKTTSSTQHGGAEVVSLRRREIFAHPPEDLHPPQPAARAAIAANIEPAHLVPLEDDPTAQKSGKARRSFWLTILAARKLGGRVRFPRVIGRGLVWSAILFAGLAGLSLLPDLLGTSEVRGTPPRIGETSEATVAQGDVETASTTVKTRANPPIVSDFDRASAYTASSGMTNIPSLATISSFTQPGLDPEVGVDALALAWPAVAGETGPVALPVPPPPDQTFALDERGFVRPSPEGQPTPEGYLVVAGPPPRPAVQRPDVEDRPIILVAIDPSTLPEDDPFRNLRPPARPLDLADRFERARFGGRTEKEMIALRPVARPKSAQDRAPVSAKPTRLAIANGPRPASRPSDMTRRFLAAAKGNAEASTTQKPSAAKPRKSSSSQVAAASTAAVDAPPVSRSNTAAPTAPSRGSVTERATQKKKLNLAEINLLGTFGASSRPRALVRMPGGKVVNVAVGDRVDGGRVSVIGKGQMKYVKSGRTVTLSMPNG